MTAKAAMKADCSSSRSVPPMITPQPQQHNNNDDGNKKNDGSQRAKMAVSRAALTATVAVGKSSSSSSSSSSSAGGSGSGSGISNRSSIALHASRQCPWCPAARGRTMLYGSESS